MLTTSTSFMIGAGLKKCIPMTSCGREVTLASEITGSDEVVVARIAPGLQISSRFSNRTVLILQVLGDRLHHEVDVAEVVEEVEPVSRAEHPVLGGLLELAALDRLVQRGLDGGADAGDLVVAASDVRPRKPALAKTSTMPVAMVPEPTTPTRLDDVELRLLVVRGRGVVVGHDDRLSGAS